MDAIWAATSVQGPEIRLAFCSSSSPELTPIQQQASTRRYAGAGERPQSVLWCSRNCAGGRGGLCAAEGPGEATAHAAACEKEDFANCDSHRNAVHSRQALPTGAVGSRLKEASMAASSGFRKQVLPTPAGQRDAMVAAVLQLTAQSHDAETKNSLLRLLVCLAACLDAASEAATHAEHGRELL